MICLQSLAWLWWGGGIHHVYSVIPHYGRKCLTLAAKRQRVKQYKGTLHTGGGGGSLHFGGGGGRFPPQFIRCRSRGRGWRAWRWLIFGGLRVLVATQLPGAVEAGKSSWSLASVLGCFLLCSWKLNGFASAEGSSPLGTRVTALCRPTHGKGDLVRGDMQVGSPAAASAALW